MPSLAGKIQLNKELRMRNDVLNLGRREQGFWDQVIPRNGYDAEFWIGEVVLSTSLKNIVCESRTEGDISRKSIQTFLTEDEFLLSLNYDKFWNAVQWHSFESETISYLNEQLYKSGIVVLNWSSFFKKSITFNHKVELKGTDLIFFHDLLDRMVYRDKIIFKENATYSFESDDFVLEFKLNIDENSSILHVKSRTTNLSYMREVLSPKNEFYYIGLEEACSILNSQMERFFEASQCVQVSSEWIRILELVENLQLSNNSVSNVNGVKSQLSLLPNIRNLVLDGMSEHIFQNSLEKKYLVGLETGLKRQITPNMNLVMLSNS
ncbi:hypothetical protein QRD38_11430 [Leptospira weilii]|uniref:hypothetical protein n=1 Tax=Leptospira weilii TaxID=28184 RepID=UPI00256F1ED7|nr:hypothetical protein [Leptospira weilii]MDL5246387.1 hypothetical protein [Leptospira weilii]